MNEQLHSLSRELAEVGRLVDDDDVISVVERMVRRAVRTIPGCEHATVTVEVAPGKLETVAGGEVAALVHHPDEPRPWEGPILDAIRYREPRRVEDAETEQRWPGFSERMRSAGFRSCLALPLPAFRRPSVGCTLFSPRPNQFTEHVMDLVMLFALHAGTTFDNAALYDDSRRLVDHLHAALATRDLIGQAKGLLMRQYSCDSEDAFDRLRRASQHHNVKLRHLAAELVEAQEQGRLEPVLSRWFATGEESSMAAAAT
ncbi:transcriptional regulator [Mycobacterium sp. MFM001]|uniref:GAF and ANTAR domain-containing protein n=1 Tax=Mycobacterium sp. MFM001 TaxID=2049453 RepID=UPI000DA4C016|nr:GAF and ANTAR domain-containing protein [Mycobacterium sp. MFM001]GBE65701.1 transcriptional regulator [Mycobacterium sp. MFM001]